VLDRKCINTRFLNSIGETMLILFIVLVSMLCCFSLFAIVAQPIKYEGSYLDFLKNVTILLLCLTVIVLASIRLSL